MSDYILIDKYAPFGKCLNMSTVTQIPLQVQACTPTLPGFTCGLDATLRVIAGKWKPLILYFLAQGGATRKQGSKQSAGRDFPCNSQLEALLLSIKPDNGPLPDKAVFTRPDGSPISRGDLRTAWYGKGKNEGVVKQLAICGAIEAYRPQYNTRHTMISQCLEAGVAPTQIAKWVGNSAEIIFRNYAGIINKSSVPEF